MLPVRGLLVACLLASLVGCFGAARQSANPAYYDLGLIPRDAVRPPPLGLRSLAVDAPSWLDSAALQYRLAYADSARRQSYAGSRWVAPPSELLEQALRRAVMSSEGALLSGGCKLRVDMDEFVHLFDGPDTSRGLIEVRATLLAPRMDTLLARRSFSLSKAAPSNDARGGVTALSGAVAELVDALSEWLGVLAAQSSGSSNLVERCRSV